MLDPPLLPLLYLLCEISKKGQESTLFAASTFKWAAFSFGDVFPIQALATAITVSLIVTLQGNIATGTKIVSTFHLESVTVEIVFGYSHRQPIWSEVKDSFQNHRGPAERDDSYMVKGIKMISRLLVRGDLFL
jgi:hypothetical protein